MFSRDRSLARRNYIARAASGHRLPPPSLSAAASRRQGTASVPSWAGSQESCMSAGRLQGGFGTERDLHGGGKPDVRLAGSAASCCNSTAARETGRIGPVGQIGPPTMLNPGDSDRIGSAGPWPPTSEGGRSARSWRNRQEMSPVVGFWLRSRSRSQRANRGAD